MVQHMYKTLGSIPSTEEKQKIQKIKQQNVDLFLMNPQLGSHFIILSTFWFFWNFHIFKLKSWSPTFLNMSQKINYSDF
jgi:hypothetical protein